MNDDLNNQFVKTNDIIQIIQHYMKTSSGMCYMLSIDIDMVIYIYI